MEASKLKKILEQHKLWVETNGMQGQRANLNCANLKGADLGDANLNCASLRGANLLDANLTGAKLNGANLEGANLTGAKLNGANLEGANLTRANLKGANLRGANLEYVKLSDAILPDISWIIPGCLVQLNQIKYEFYLYKDRKYENFIQDTFGFFIQNNPIEGTFDMLVEDRIIRNIPDWLKYTGLKQVATV